MDMFCVLVDIMGPDDFRPRVNNNAYTNAAVSLAIHWARYMACLCNRSVSHAGLVPPLLLSYQ